MTDALEALEQAEALLRKVDHCLKTEIGRRLCCDVESLLQTIRMIEIEQRQKEERRHD